MPFIPSTAIAIKNPILVSVLTPLLAFKGSGSVGSLGTADAVLFSVQNVDAVNSATITMETSQDGSSVDLQAPQYTIAPGQQCSMEISPQQLRRYFAITAQAVAGSVALTYEVVTGVQR